MKTPYYVMETNYSAAMVFDNKEDLHDFAIEAAEQVQALLNLIESGMADSRSQVPVRLVSLGFNLAWQVSQAIRVLKEGPTLHNDTDWTENRGGQTP